LKMRYPINREKADTFYVVRFEEDSLSSDLYYDVVVHALEEGHAAVMALALLMVNTGLVDIDDDAGSEEHVRKIVSFDGDHRVTVFLHDFSYTTHMIETEDYSAYVDRLKKGVVPEWVVQKYNAAPIYNKHLVPNETIRKYGLRCKEGVDMAIFIAHEYKEYLGAWGWSQ
jgi:hypothetical protein